ncbi:MAG: lysostaphin resistance A-like protein [Terriglobales bacterium]
MSIWYGQAEARGFGQLRAGWRLLVFLLILLGVPAALIWAARASGRMAGGGGGTLPGSTVLSEGVLFGWVLLVSWIMSRLEDRPLGAYGLPRRGAFGRRFWLGVGWGVVALTALLMLIFVSGDFSFGQVVLHGAAIEKFSLEWAAAFLAVGFFEEFIFRGYALRTLSEGIGFWPAAVVLSAVFGGVHLGNGGEDWMGALSAGLIGLFFCFTVRRTGTLWFAVGMHGAWDWCESFLYGVPDSGMAAQGRLLHPSFRGSHWITGGSVGPEGSMWVLLVVLLLFALFDEMTHKTMPRRETAESGG